MTEVSRPPHSRRVGTNISRVDPESCVKPAWIWGGGSWIGLEALDYNRHPGGEPRCRPPLHRVFNFVRLANNLDE